MLTLPPRAPLALLLAGALLITGPARAEVRNLMAPCEGRLCPWFQAVVTPPAGWQENKAYGEESRMLILQPRKAKLRPSDPLIYVRASLIQDRRTLDEFIQVSQSRWRDSVPDTRIEKLPDIPRDGRDPARLFRYANPSRPRQAHELIAFVDASETDGRRFVHMVVLTASNRKAVDDAEAALRAIVGGL
jgi:hypothetical protein